MNNIILDAIDYEKLWEGIQNPDNAHFNEINDKQCRKEGISKGRESMQHRRETKEKKGN